MKLSIQMYKYGSAKHIDVLEFADKNDLEQWLIKEQENTEFHYQEEKECGESLTKWTGRFEYNNVKYNLVFDL